MNPKFSGVDREIMRPAIFIMALLGITCFVFQDTVWAASKNKKVTVPVRDSYTKGSKSAPVTLVEFTDYQCPACAKFHRKIYPKFFAVFVKTGNVRFVSRDFPLDFHKNAFRAARAARCAGDQKRFWKMRHLLSSNPRRLSQSSLLKYAKKLRLNMRRFRTCLKSKRYDRAIKIDMADGERAGVTGTPGFIIGHTPQRGSRFFRGKIFMGVPPYKFYREWVDYLIATQD